MRQRVSTAGPTNKPSDRGVRFACGEGSVKTRGRSQHALEHAGKRGRAAVAEIEGDRRDRLTARQSRNCLQHRGTSLPLGKAQTCLAPEHACERASAHCQGEGPCVDALMRRGTFEKAAASRRQRLVCRKWYDEQLPTRGVQLQKKKIDNGRGAAPGFVFDAKIDGFDQKSTQQRRNFQHPTLVWHGTRGRAFDVDTSSDDLPKRAKAVPDTTWNP